VKNHLEIIKGLSLLLLLFVLVSAIGVADNTYKVSVTVVQRSSPGDGDDANTVINTYTKESGSPETNVKCEISGSCSSVITSEGNKISTKNIDSDTNQGFQLDGLTLEEYNDEVSEWVLSTLNEGQLVTFDDFPQDVTDIINV
jgi:hypothetical protein